MKKLLFLIILSTGWQAFAMEDELVTLQSSDGQDFRVEVKKAKLSGTIKNMIKDTGIGQPIPLQEINAQTLNVIVNLLDELEPLVKESKNDPYLYIPRAFQPKVNDKIKNVDMAFNVFLAANYLDIPFILNGAAAAVVDKLERNKDCLDLTLDELLKTLLQKDRDKAKATFEKIHEIYKITMSPVAQVRRLNTIPYDLWKYIARHAAMRVKRIEQEYSIADLIKDCGQPKMDRFLLNLTGRKLTSLFGITLLENIKNAKQFYLSNNCIFDTNLDPQGLQYPFDGLNKLEMLHLSSCSLVTIHPGWAKGLESLQELDLGNNMLVDLQPGWAKGLGNLKKLIFVTNRFTTLQPGWAKGLDNLLELDLSWNRLTTLQPGWAQSLLKLKQLCLLYNKLNDQEEEKIRKELPNVQIKFGQQA